MLICISVDNILVTLVAALVIFPSSIDMVEDGVSRFSHVFVPSEQISCRVFGVYYFGPVGSAIRLCFS